jgi:endonuclease/exonuclease/phosphatase family metal-dependent hydrolase
MVWLARTLLVMIATAAATVSVGQEFRTIPLMSWNVENLFDTADDQANPFDDTFLPKAVKDARPDHAAHCRQVNPIPAFARECIEIDWTDDKLSRKLQAIAEVIRAVRPQPDVIILPELENPGILARLNTEFLAGLGYTTAIELDTTVTALDRGIDVGILSRLPSAAAPTAHKVEFGNDTDLCRATRDIVAAPLALPDGRTLHLYAVHFPSGGNPIECRERAMRTLNALSAALPADAIAVAGGDFNFPCNEPQGDLFGRLLTEGRWNVPPEVRTGCDEPGSNKFRNTRPGNRSWFTWSFLDFFLVSDSLLTERPSPVGWFANLGSFRTAVVSAQQVEASDQGFVSPRRYDFDAGSGISDHWPVMIELVTRP